MGVDGLSEDHEGVKPSLAHDAFFPPLSWDKDGLLDLSDLVRSGLDRNRTSDLWIDRLNNFLEKAIKDGAQPSPTLGLETIEYAHLDKLIADIVRDGGTFGEKPSMQGGRRLLEAGPQLRSRVNASNAKRLKHIWRRRFHDGYSGLDQTRSTNLQNRDDKDGTRTRGGLADVSFQCTKETEGLGQWKSSAKQVMYDLEGSFPFEPGHWWLNITCAERDGIVSSSLEKPSTGRYGITVTPLLTGCEEVLQKNLFKYTRQGACSDMHISLISQVGRQIHIIRGYQLKSILAPEAGVRYDGLFVLKQYGHKLDSSTGIYRLELTFERSAGQISLESIQQIPKPSQLDN